MDCVHVAVSQEYCERSGECIGLVPAVFSAADDGTTVAIDGEVPLEFEDGVRDAVEFCPRLALSITP